MRHPIHTHRCQHCGEPFECGGELERNYDGWPEVVCQAFHVYRFVTLCDACTEREAREDETAGTHEAA